MIEERLAHHPNRIRAQRFRDAAQGPPDVAAIREAVLSFGVIIGRLDAALGQTEWLADGHYSLADIAISPFVERLDNLGMGDLWEPFPNAKRWRAAMLPRPAITGARAPLEFRLPVHYPAPLKELTG